jgi:translation initiation factor IF-2
VSGTKLTGQTNGFSLINRKKEEPKITLISLVRPVLQEQLIRIKQKIAKPSTQRPPGVPGAPNPNKITPNVGGGGFNANRSSRPDS